MLESSNRTNDFYLFSCLFVITVWKNVGSPKPLKGFVISRSVNMTSSERSEHSGDHLCLRGA